jgi:hypothetical protein
MLVVNTDAVLPLPVPFELFQTIARRNLQIFEVSRGIQHGKFSLRNSSWWRAAGLARSPDFRRLLRGETLDHPFMITVAVNNVNRY